MGANSASWGDKTGNELFSMALHCLDKSCTATLRNAHGEGTLHEQRATFNALPRYRRRELYQVEEIHHIVRVGIKGIIKDVRDFAKALPEIQQWNLAAILGNSYPYFHFVEIGNAANREDRLGPERAQAIAEQKLDDEEAIIQEYEQFAQESYEPDVDTTDADIVLQRELLPSMFYLHRLEKIAGRILKQYENARLNNSAEYSQQSDLMERPLDNLGRLRNIACTGINSTLAAIRRTWNDLEARDRCLLNAIMENVDKTFAVEEVVGLLKSSEQHI